MAMSSNATSSPSSLLRDRDPDVAEEELAATDVVPGAPTQAEFTALAIERPQSRCLTKQVCDAIKEILMLEESGRSKKYQQIIFGYTDVNGVAVPSVRLPWTSWNAAAKAITKSKWMVDKKDHKIFVTERKVTKEVIPVENHISCFAQCYVAKFGAGTTFDKNKANDIRSDMTGKYYINAKFFFDEFLLALLPQAPAPTLTATQVALVGQNSRGEPEGANVADATLNQYMAAASAAGVTGPSINYYGPVQLHHFHGDVNHNHSQVADAKILERILHLGEINVDISKDISKNVRNLEDNIASSVKKPASIPPKIDLDEVRTGNLFGAGRAQLEDEYTNRLVGQDPSPVSPRLAHVGLDDIFDSNGHGDKENDSSKDKECDNGQSSNGRELSYDSNGQTSCSTKWFSHIRSAFEKQRQRKKKYATMINHPKDENFPTAMGSPM